MMTTIPRASIVTIGLLAASAAGAAAQPPPIANARVTSQPAGSSLKESIGALVGSMADVGWIGYSVPVVAGDRTMCCFGSGNTYGNGTVIRSDGSTCCETCRLEPSSSTSMASRPPQPPGVVKLEGSGEMTVLMRVAAGRVERVRVFSEDCRLDAGGRAVTWIENVQPVDSVAFLESLATGRSERDRVTEGAISALALHRDGSADAALERLLAPSQPLNVRRTVPFWLGNSRGARGLETLRRIVREDASTDVRKKAVFGIAQSPEPPALQVLIDAARSSDLAAVRGEAIFWLAQKAGRKAAAAITERIEHDPDTDVKKRAVFALSQLPKDEGVPLLITVARTHSNPAVRKQAMFWLGQSQDSRALEFFAEVLR